jgi:hypothetical protein
MTAWHWLRLAFARVAIAMTGFGMLMKSPHIGLQRMYSQKRRSLPRFPQVINERVIAKPIKLELSARGWKRAVGLEPEPLAEVMKSLAILDPFWLGVLGIFPGIGGAKETALS